MPYSAQPGDVFKLDIVKVDVYKALMLSHKTALPNCFCYLLYYQIYFYLRVFSHLLLKFVFLLFVDQNSTTETPPKQVIFIQIIKWSLVQSSLWLCGLYVDLYAQNMLQDK